MEQAPHDDVRLMTVTARSSAGRIKWTYYHPTSFRLVKRKHDNMPMWRLDTRFGAGRRSWKLAVEDTLELAAKRGYGVLRGTGHGVMIGSLHHQVAHPAEVELAVRGALGE